MAARNDFDRPRVVDKRVRGSPSGLTPQQRQKTSRVGTTPSTARRQLIAPQSKEVVDPAKSARGARAHVWSTQDKLALVNFILLSGDRTNWILSQKPSIWEAAAYFVNESCGTIKTSKCYCDTLYCSLYLDF